MKSIYRAVRHEIMCDKEASCAAAWCAGSGGGGGGQGGGVGRVSSLMFFSHYEHRFFKGGLE